jgi:hypothetical protein
MPTNTATEPSRAAQFHNHAMAVHPRLFRLAWQIGLPLYRSFNLALMAFLACANRLVRQAWLVLKYSQLSHLSKCGPSNPNIRQQIGEILSRITWPDLLVDLSGSVELLRAPDGHIVPLDTFIRAQVRLIIYLPLVGFIKHFLESRVLGRRGWAYCRAC